MPVLDLTREWTSLWYKLRWVLNSMHYRDSNQPAELMGFISDWLCLRDYSIFHIVLTLIFASTIPFPFRLAVHSTTCRLSIFGDSNTQRQMISSVNLRAKSLQKRMHGIFENNTSTLSRGGDKEKFLKSNEMFRKTTSWGSSWQNRKPRSR